VHRHFKPAELAQRQAPYTLAQDLHRRLVLQLVVPATVLGIADDVVVAVLDLPTQGRRPDDAQAERKRAAAGVGILDQRAGQVQVAGIRPVPRIGWRDLRVARREDRL
jgi:hypothetical protein